MGAGLIIWKGFQSGRSHHRKVWLSGRSYHSEGLTIFFDDSLYVIISQSIVHSTNEMLPLTHDLCLWVAGVIIWKDLAASERFPSADHVLGGNVVWRTGAVGDGERRANPLTDLKNTMRNYFSQVN